jgi:hypothetical protein
LYEKKESISVLIWLEIGKEDEEFT